MSKTGYQKNALSEPCKPIIERDVSGGRSDINWGWMEWEAFPLLDVVVFVHSYIASLAAFLYVLMQLSQGAQVPWESQPTEEVSGII